MNDHKYLHETKQTFVKIVGYCSNFLLIIYDKRGEIHLGKNHLKSYLHGEKYNVSRNSDVRKN